MLSDVNVCRHYFFKMGFVIYCHPLGTSQYNTVMSGMKQVKYSLNKSLHFKFIRMQHIYIFVQVTMLLI